MLLRSDNNRYMEVGWWWQSCPFTEWFGWQFGKSDCGWHIYIGPVYFGRFWGDWFIDWKPD